jgi:hypothetical protein
MIVIMDLVRSYRERIPVFYGIILSAENVYR